jgi:hypothetical protein
VRVALLLYVAALALRLAAPQRRRAARALWTIGCALFLAHVGAAFHFFHGWSHGDAYRETARQTGEMVRVEWGGGIYLNYLFTAVWAADVVSWWRGLEAYDRRPRWVGLIVHTFMGFMAFNATVVFETGPVRWIALGACAGLAALGVLRIRRGSG